MVWCKDFVTRRKNKGVEGLKGQGKHFSTVEAQRMEQGFVATQELGVGGGELNQLPEFNFRSGSRGW